MKTTTTIAALLTIALPLCGLAVGCDPQTDEFDDLDDLDDLDYRTFEEEPVAEEPGLGEEEEEEFEEPVGFIWDNEWNCVWKCAVPAELIHSKPVCEENKLDAWGACLAQGAPLPGCFMFSTEWTGEWC